MKLILLILKIIIKNTFKNKNIWNIKIQLNYKIMGLKKKYCIIKFNFHLNLKFLFTWKSTGHPKEICEKTGKRFLNLEEKKMVKFQF
jgi:hypothetical protein